MHAMSPLNPTVAMLLVTERINELRRGADLGRAGRTGRPELRRLPHHARNDEGLAPEPAGADAHARIGTRVSQLPLQEERRS
jgi:hypothetical protein